MWRNLLSHLVLGDHHDELFSLENEVYCCICMCIVVALRDRNRVRATSSNSTDLLYLRTKEAYTLFTKYSMRRWRNCLASFLFLLLHVSKMPKTPAYSRQWRRRSIRILAASSRRKLIHLRRLLFHYFIWMPSSTSLLVNLVLNTHVLRQDRLLFFEFFSSHFFLFNFCSCSSRMSRPFVIFYLFRLKTITNTNNLLRWMMIKLSRCVFPILLLIWMMYAEFTVLLSAILKKWLKKICL